MVLLRHFLVGVIALLIVIEASAFRVAPLAFRTKGKYYGMGLLSTKKEPMLADRNLFKSFFQQKAASQGMTIEMLRTHDDLSIMLSQGDITLQQLYQCWAMVAGVDSQQVDETTAYAILLKTMASGKSKSEPNSNPRASEDYQYLKQEYEHLMEVGKGKVTLKDLLKWEEVQAIVADEFCTAEEVQAIWMKVAGAKSTIGWEDFVSINRELDDMFASMETDDDDVDDMEEGAIARYDEDAEGDGEDGDVEQGTLVDIDDYDVWDPKFDPTALFENEFLEYLTEFYSKRSANGGLSFEDFIEWDDVLFMVNEGSLDASCLRELWAEALENSAKKSKPSADRISLDTFFRLNIRLDNVVNEIKEALENLTDEDVEAYYRAEFEILSKSTHGVVTYAALLKWPDVQEMLSSGDLQVRDLDQIWEALPKEKSDRSGNSLGFEPAIGVDAFVALNTAIEDLVTSTVVMSSSPVSDDDV